LRRAGGWLIPDLRCNPLRVDGMVGPVTQRRPAPAGQRWAGNLCRPARPEAGSVPLLTRAELA
jgi:hypothetical protein